MKKNAVVMVSLPHCYGIASDKKPFPKMEIHGWTMPENTSRLESLYDTLDSISRFIYEPNVEIVDAEESMKDLNQLFVVVHAVVHAKDYQSGTSWHAKKAFIGIDAARRFADQIEEEARECHSCEYCWVFTCNKV